MKVLKVTSQSIYGEAVLTHNIGKSAPEEMYVVAILQGVINAGSMIKSFEIQEA
jgi:hypothetical protein